MRHLGKNAVIALALVGAGFFAAYLRFRPFFSQHGSYSDGHTRYENTSGELIRHAVWDQPAPLEGGVNSEGNEGRACVSPDGRLLVFSSGELGLNADLFAAFLEGGLPQEPRPLVELNSLADDLSPCFGAGGLYFASNRAGGAGGMDLYCASYRDGVFEPAVPVAGVNTERNETDPAPGRDLGTGEFAIAFASDGDSFWRGDYDLYLARGGQVAALEELNSSSEERDPCFSADGRVLFFASNRSGSRGGYDLYRSAEEGGAWIPPTPVPGLNTSRSERAPSPSADGFVMQFARGEPSGPHDIFRAKSLELFKLPGRPVGWIELVVLVSLILLALLAFLAKHWESLDLVYRCFLASVLGHLLLMWWLRDVYPEIYPPGEPIQLVAGEGLFEVRFSPNHARASGRSGEPSMARRESSGSAPALELDPGAGSPGTPEPGPMPIERRHGFGEGLERQPTSLSRSEVARPWTEPVLAGPLSEVVRKEGVAPALDIGELAQGQASARDNTGSSLERMPGGGASTVHVPTVGTSLPVLQGISGNTGPTERIAAAPGGLEQPVAIAQPIEAKPAEMLAGSNAGSGSSGSDRLALGDFAAPELTRREGPGALAWAQVPTAGPMPSVGVSAVGGPMAGTSPTWLQDVSRAGSAERVAEPPGGMGQSVSISQPIEAKPAERPAGSSAGSGTSGSDQLALGDFAAPELTRRGEPGALARAQIPSAERTPGGGASAVQMPSVGPGQPWLQDVSGNAGATERVAAASGGLEQSVAIAQPLEAKPAEMQAERSGDSGGTGSSGSDQLALGDFAGPELTRRGEPGALARAQLPSTLSPAPAVLKSSLPPTGADRPLKVERGEGFPWQQTPYQARVGVEKELALERHGGSPQTEQAVAAGLAYLARIQAPEGRWGSAGDAIEKYGDVSVGKSGLCLLAFLGAGHTPDSDTLYSDVAGRAVRFLLSQQDRASGHFGDTSAYSHGIATYALAECYAMSHAEELRSPLEAAVAHIVGNQCAAADRRGGGWSYFYADGHIFDRWPRVSISAWQIMALESARIGGLGVDEAVFERAKEFLLGSYEPRGGWFRYSHDPERLDSPYATLPASTPAALFCLSLLGEDIASKQYAPPRNFTMRRAPDGFERPTDDEFVIEARGNLYFWYYGTLAAFRCGGAPWRAWNERLKATLLPAQEPDGSWEPIEIYALRYAGDDDDDRSYTTSLCVLSLEIYYRYFTPLLQVR